MTFVYCRQLETIAPKNTSPVGALAHLSQRLVNPCYVQTQGHLQANGSGWTHRICLQPIVRHVPVSPVFSSTCPALHSHPAGTSQMRSVVCFKKLQDFADAVRRLQGMHL